MVANVLGDLQASGALLFSHQSRLLRLRFAQSSGIPENSLLPQTVKGDEGLSRCYRYVLDCLSADAFVELKDFQGQPIEIAILLPDGGERLLTGVVTGAESRGGDGGFAHYRLTIEPALATLAHRRNSRVFQDKSIIEIVQAILDEHRAASQVFAASFKHETRTTRASPPRSYTAQYRESDLAFIERLLFEEGLSYRFTHGPEAGQSIRDAVHSHTAGKDHDTPLHTLIIFDAAHPHAQGTTGKVRFHRTDGAATEDAIDRWEGRRQLQASQSSLATYDYKTASHYPGTESRRTDHGARGNHLAATLEDYDPQTLYYGSDPGETERYARLRQQARDLASKTFLGEGTTRALEVGTWFELQDHPVHDQDNREDRQFLVTSLSFEARNNLLPAEGSAPDTRLASAPGSGQNQPPYRNSFAAVRRHVPVVPEFHLTRHQKPTAVGSTTATVVGPAGEEIFTDEHGRIKIQFHWQRKQDHPEGGADLDDRSSAWVRVAYPSAGAQWGTQYVPRIGQEVVVDFLEGDVDRPLVTGVVYNGAHRPPTFSGAGQLPANKALSGVKTKEYKGSRYNELLFDDSTGELRTKLSSEHAATQLNQGYLIHPRSDGKGAARGEGFELCTDAAGAIRAAKGLLLSAEPAGRADGRQLDRDVLLQVLTAALDLAERLGDHAAEQQANRTETGRGNQQVEADALPGPKMTTGHQTQLKAALDNLERGSNTDVDGKSGGGEQPGGQHVVAVSGPDGVALASPQSVSVAAGSNLDQVAQRDTNQSSGRRWIHNAAESISLFVSGSSAKVKDTFKLIAAKGKMSLQAQDGEMDVIAKLGIRIASVNGNIVLEAPSEILLKAGGGYIRIGSNIEIHNPGTQSQKAASFSLAGPASLAAAAPALPQSRLKPCALKFADAAGSGAAAVPR